MHQICILSELLQLNVRQRECVCVFLCSNFLSSFFVGFTRNDPVPNKSGMEVKKTQTTILFCQFDTFLFQKNCLVGNRINFRKISTHRSRILSTRFPTCFDVLSFSYSSRSSQCASSFGTICHVKFALIFVQFFSRFSFLFLCFFFSFAYFLILFAVIFGQLFI